MILSAPEARVVGALVEKELTTPQQYPLTANALLLACNQASNRLPVVAYTEDQVAAALDSLREQRLVRFVLPSHGRSVIRYRHVLDEAWALDNRQAALLAVLLLRGPQTAAELRARTERMAEFDGLADVERSLASLGALEEPLVRCVGRGPGQKEDRWAELLQAPAAVPTGGAAGPVGPVPAGHLVGGGDDDAAGRDSADDGPAPAGGAPAVPLREELAAVRDELARLRAEVGELAGGLEELRRSLGG